jgi:alpha-pyrone synthase
MTIAHINRIATAVPQHDVHQAFIDFATGMLPEGTVRNLFRRMARLSAIEHRYSFVQPISTEDGQWKDAEEVYVPGDFPPTARRMKLFEPSPRDWPGPPSTSSHSLKKNAAA